MAPLRFLLVALLCIFHIASVAARPMAFPAKRRCPSNSGYVKSLGCRRLPSGGLKIRRTIYGRG